MITYRDYQQEAIDAPFDYWRKGNAGNPLVTAPTGAGKSIICSGIIEKVLSIKSDTRIIVVTHVKELIEQNSEKAATLLPDAEIGLYSAGLSRRDDCQIMFAGVQSIYRKIYDFDPFEIMIVDECHLIPKSGNGRYQQLIERLKKMNPLLKVIGLTATPFRLSSGLLTEGADALFDDIVYEIPVSLLIERGYLCPLITKGSKTVADLKGVKKSAGEYNINDMVERFEDVTPIAIDEALSYSESQNRKHMLFFCCNVDHTTHVRDYLRASGVTAEMVTGDTAKTEREQIIADFKSGKIQALANCNVLTTGFDAPKTDMVVFLRATASAGLYVQMCGRGMRTAEGKSDCLVLDYGENIIRHGCVDDVKPKQKGKGGVAPMKQCPKCDEVINISISTCPACGFEFPPPEKQAHETSASDAAILKSQITHNWHQVDGVTYSRHVKQGKPDSMRVSYRCGLRTFSEWICLNHDGYAKQKADRWIDSRITLRSYSNYGTTEALEAAIDDLLREPLNIQVDESGKYPHIIGFQFEEMALI